MKGSPRARRVEMMMMKWIGGCSMSVDPPPSRRLTRLKREELLEDALTLAQSMRVCNCKVMVVSHHVCAGITLNKFEHTVTQCTHVPNMDTGRTEGEMTKRPTSSQNLY
jgi:ribosomal protein L32